MGLQSPHRTRQDDRATLASRDHVGYTGFHRLPHAREIDVLHFLPVELVGLVQWCTTGSDSGVGHDDIESTQLLDAGVHRGLHRVEVTDVGFERHDPTVETLDQLDRFGHVFRCCRGDLRVLPDRTADVERDDIRAFLREPHRVTTPLTTSRPSDERDLSFNSPCHDPPLALRIERLLGAELSELSTYFPNCPKRIGPISRSARTRCANRRDHAAGRWARTRSSGRPSPRAGPR